MSDPPAADVAAGSPTAVRRAPAPSAPIPAGAFAMGDAHDEGYPADGERPVHRVWVSAFDIDVTTVTNAAFAEFVADTGFVTDAQRLGSSAVFAGNDLAPGVPIPATPWWSIVDGARWDRPFGGDSSIADRLDHPVVHVSHRDAQAFCAWSGRALPTEAQWERAARGGLEGARFPWGDEEPTTPRTRCAIFTGDFPDRPDGEVGTVGVTSFAPNGFGIFQSVGNVWEWCADRFSARWYRRSPYRDPTGPERGAHRVLRGGSHLCHDSYCRRYRVAARSHSTPTSSAGNIGFRTVGCGGST